MISRLVPQDTSWGNSYEDDGYDGEDHDGLPLLEGLSPLHDRLAGFDDTSLLLL